MKLKTIKTLAEVVSALSQPQDMSRDPVEITTKDGSIRSVRIGGLLISGSYGIEVSQEVQFEEATRYRVTAKAEGFDNRVQYFETYSAASDFKRSFGAAATVDLDEDVKVLIDDSGEVVRDLSHGTGNAGCDGPAIPLGDELTF